MNKKLLVWIVAALAVSAVIALLILPATGSRGSASSGTFPASKQVSNSELRDLIAKGVRLVDVRTAAEYGGGHIAMVLPVMRELRKLRPDVECVLLALTTGYGRAVHAGERPMGYRNFLHLIDAAAATRWGQQLRGANKGERR